MHGDNNNEKSELSEIFIILMRNQKQDKQFDIFWITSWWLQAKKGECKELSQKSNDDRYNESVLVNNLRKCGGIFPT